MKYKISIEATLNSNLSKKDLKNSLVLALYDECREYTKLDGIDEELDILDYSQIEVKEV